MLASSCGAWKSHRLTRHATQVTWSGHDDPENPKNWSNRRKWAATFVVSSFTFISPVSSSMIAPAIDTLAEDFDVTSDVEAQMMLSIFVLSYGFGPLLLGPMSEVFGRVRVLQLSNIFYLIWNLGCGFTRNKQEMIVFRLLAGIGGSAPMAVGGGVLGDCWHPEERGKAVGIYSLAPLLGPALGPLVGAWIAEKTTWRWVFWSTSITAVFVQISGLFLLQETYPATLLKRKADRLRKESGNTKLYTEFESDKTLGNILSIAAVRALRMLATQPIIQVITVYLAYLFGLFYLILSTFPKVWQGVYQESVGVGGLNYLSLGIGFLLGAQTAAQLMDRIYQRLKLQNNDIGCPEFRIPLTFVGSCLIPIGLFWYGWSVEAKTHWIVPNTGIAIFGAGAMICMQCMQTYIIDNYTLYAASGLAAGMTLRSLAGFGFPLFVPNMYDALGYGWGNSVVAFVGMAIGLPAPFLFWFYGKKLREMSN